jgi:acyl-coenzyme A thioesterase PaaI-like protein
MASMPETQPQDAIADGAAATEPGEPDEATRAIGALLTSTVPMVATLQLEYVEVTPERAVLRLPDRPEYRNHVGGPHAGAMFTLGESASGAVVLAAFGDTLDRATPLPVRAEVDYRKIARGDLVATAVLGRPAADVLAELDAGVRPEFPVEVATVRPDGAETGRMTVTWTLRPNA